MTVNSGEPIPQTEREMILSLFSVREATSEKGR